MKARLGRKNQILSKRRSDPLTGLGSPKHLGDFYLSVNKTDSEHYSLAYISFDYEQAVKMFGIDKCEKLQIDVAKLILSSCEVTDCASRIDDGTFLICARGKSVLNTQQKINDLLSIINENVSKFFDNSSFNFKSGIYHLENNEISFDTAVRYAELSYNYAAESNTTSFIFTKELQKSESRLNHLREKLVFAIDNKEFDVFLQFIYSVKENAFTNAEVLSRWNSPSEGFLMPAYYINDMRKTGVIEKFDMYMFEKTCALLEQFKNTDMKNLKLSFNITRTTLSSKQFIKEFRSIIKKHKFDHSLLTFEITEDSLIDKNVASSNISECRESGFKIALDDFTLGNKSIEDISAYPIDQLKLSRKITLSSSSDDGKSSLNDLIEYAHKTNLQVVCGGVETKEQNDVVTNCNTDLIQGYYYSYVFPLDEGKDYFKQSAQRLSELN